MSEITIPCGECEGNAVWYPSSEHVYSKDYGPIYLCGCGASVGVHHRGKKPLGTPAGRELREMRKRVHALLDPRWKSGDFSRRGTYKWLANRLDIPFSECHVGMFDKNLCEQAIGVLTTPPHQ